MYTYGKEFSVLFTTIMQTLGENKHPQRRRMCSLCTRIDTQLALYGSGSLNSALWCAVRVAFHLPVQPHLLSCGEQEFVLQEARLRASIEEAVKELGWDTDLRCNKYRLLLILEDLLLEVSAED